METTYLFKENTPDGSKKLRIGTRREFEEVKRKNSTLPLERQRYFIKEKSLDSKKPDILYIEVDREEYDRWNKENVMRCRNLKEEKKFKSVPMTSVERGVGYNRLYEQALCKEDPGYDDICAKMLFEALCRELSRWRPWALDMLGTYLDDGADVCAMKFANKYGISVQTARKYIRQFEQRIKIFLEGVSF